MSCCDGGRVSAARSGSERFQIAGDLVEAAEHRRHPAGAELDDAEPQVAVALEHAVEHHRPDEQLGRVVQADHVLAADVLAAAEPVGRHRRGRCS